MAIRSSWKGYLKVSLVSVPLKAYTATSSSTGRAISFNQLHETCHSRIQYRKVCPVHGEVSNDEIVSGYEYAKGHYVIVDPEEIEQLRTPTDKSITVDTFVAADAVDPMYHSGQTYFLVPDGPIGQKPYALIRQSMAEDNLHAVGTVVLSSRERLVLLRPVEDVIAMTVLHYDAEIKHPESFEDELTTPEYAKDELKLTKTLLHALARKDFDISGYRDEYVDKMTQLIESKVEGKELVTPPPAEEPQIINLMEALKESVRRVQPSEEPKKKPPRKKAPSARTRQKEAKQPAKEAKKKRRSG